MCCLVVFILIYRYLFLTSTCFNESSELASIVERKRKCVQMSIDLRVCCFIYITLANNYLLTPLLYTLFQFIFFTMLLFYDSVLDVTAVVFVVLWIQVDSERVLPFLDILIHSMKCQK